jgi:hypothetical protein
LFALLAHETAGAARTRHSLLPLFLRRDNEFGKARAKPCREIADAHPSHVVHANVPGYRHIWMSPSVRRGDDV